jgi:hypothetical protein
MIDAILNLLCGCRHRQLTRPITPVHKVGTLAAPTYVACLECGKQFHYDLGNMRIGEPVLTPAKASAAGQFQTQY